MKVYVVRKGSYCNVLRLVGDPFIFVQTERVKIDAITFTKDEAIVDAEKIEVYEDEVYIWTVEVER
jgi:hypothetical protein